MAEQKSDDLVSSIDKAAEYLLKQASTPNTNNEGGVEAATLAEQVKAFQAVVAWADKRRDLLPKDKTESAFDRLSNDFNGAAPRRRRGRPASPASDIGSAADDGDGSLDA